LVLGNEFSVAAFINPSLARAGHLRFLPAIQIFALLFGKIMPFWMASTLYYTSFSWPLLGGGRRFGRFSFAGQLRCGSS
jgi:hypothetical protein